MNMADEEGGSPQEEAKGGAAMPPTDASASPPPPAEADAAPAAAEATAEAASASPPSAADDNKPTATVVNPLPLDWTKLNDCADDPSSNPANVVRYPWDVAEIDPTDTHLELVGTHGSKITRMGGAQLPPRVSPHLTHLVLRSHLIRTMEGVAGMPELELLELYDNMVDELRELDGKETGEDGEKDGLPGKNLRVLDVSYNVIRDMKPVSFCPNLQELYIAQNKIKSIKGLKHLKLLRKIDLGANRIRVMEEDELSGLVNLEELWLGKNKIERIGGISKLTKLRRLDVQSNRLTKIENLEAQVDTLEELYLAHNGIDVEGAKCDTGLALPFTKLNTLDLGRNRLTDATPFGHLTSLTDLWISGNDIKTFEDIEPLRTLTALDSVYLEYNPLASDYEYRKKVEQMIPSLTQIDATMIGGLARAGYASPMGSGGNLEERMRLMQEAAIQKAKAEAEKCAAAAEEGSEAAKAEAQSAVEKPDGTEKPKESSAADETDEQQKATDPEGDK